MKADLLDTPAKTLAGLIFKARYAAREDNAYDEDVMKSIVEDLLEMAEREDSPMSETAKPSRRLFLAAGPASAVFGALALSAALPSVDPIFAAIERHKAAWDAFGEAGPAADNILAKQQGRVVTQADCDALDAASELEREVFGEMLNTSPTTLPDCGRP